MVAGPVPFGRELPGQCRFSHLRGAQQGKHRKLFQPTADALQELLTADPGTGECEISELKSENSRETGDWGLDKALSV